MCGRFTLKTPAAELVEQFELATIPQLELRFNIAPTQQVPIVRLAKAKGGRGKEDEFEPDEGDRLDASSLSDGRSDADAHPLGLQRELVMVRWGLIPGWADDPSIGNRMINARSEAVASKPAFRQAFKRRRCLVVADGFYEWQKTGGKKQPWYFALANERPLAFAGLWERWSKGDEPIESCTILTTDANELVAPVHDRMPVILEPQNYGLWLDPDIEDAAPLEPLLRPLPAERMKSREVGRVVNSPANEGPKCLEPEQKALF